MRSPFDERGDEQSAVRGTNDDASACKLSAVLKGYYEDPFVAAFAPAGEPLPRSPLMNRGYYVRVRAVQQLVTHFCTLHSDSGGGADTPQVVLLGAGYDTLFFRSFADDRAHKCKFFEVDYPQVIERKARVIGEHPVMSQMAPLVKQQQHEGMMSFHSPRYTLMSCDLSDVANTARCFASSDVDFERPTIFISECVLIYVDPVKGSELIQWTATAFANSSFVCYEQIRPNTAFGKTMIRNLKRQNIPLHSILSFPDLEAQKKRYEDAGYAHVRATDMLNVLKSYVAPPPRCEIFDEFEEFNMMMQHYVLLVASKEIEAIPEI